MKYLAMMLICFALACQAYAQDNSLSNTVIAAEDIVYRAPFNFNLHVAQGKNYQESFDKVAYVEKGNVYIFAGESFGVNVEVKDNAIVGLKFQQDLAKSDITLRFGQESKDDGSLIMVLKIESKLKESLYFDAGTITPGKKEASEVTIVPVAPGVAGYASWQYPIVRLVLSNFRFEK